MKLYLLSIEAERVGCFFDVRLWLTHINIQSRLFGIYPS